MAYKSDCFLTFSRTIFPGTVDGSEKYGSGKYYKMYNMFQNHFSWNRGWFWEKRFWANLSYFAEPFFLEPWISWIFLEPWISWICTRIWKTLRSARRLQHWIANFLGTMDIVDFLGTVAFIDTIDMHHNLKYA